MQIADPTASTLRAEREVYEELLELDDKRILDLGCGGAWHTRFLAEGGSGRRVTGLEVDAIQHRKNLAIEGYPNITFRAGGAEAIPAEDESFDLVFMFKSLHHVPEPLMDQALSEIRRVLVPGGLAWISEPVFAGDFNEVLRLFHDESRVRRAAFEAVKRAVENGVLALERQIFFLNPMHFEDFDEFAERIIGVTHTRHDLSEEKLAQVRTAFERHMTDDGAHFAQPVRVDLLRRD